jgi:hypothetical protein
MEDVAAMVEAATPKSAKRGPYKRRIAHCCEIMFRIVAIAVTRERQTRLHADNDTDTAHSVRERRGQVYVNSKARWNLPTTRADLLEMRGDRQKPPNRLAEQQASNELVKLIRKLRWMGLEEEAERVEDELILRRVAAADSVIAAPRETD